MNQLKDLRSVFAGFFSLSLSLLLLAGTEPIMAGPQQGIPKAEPGPATKGPTQAKRGMTNIKRSRGGLGIGGAPAAAIRKDVANKNESARPSLKNVRETQYYRITVARGDRTFLGLNYYPALPGENPPVILLIHEKDRSSRDFSDKIEELKDPNGLAAELQRDGFAVVTLDVGGLGDPSKRNAAVSKSEQAKAAGGSQPSAAAQLNLAVNDLRLAYQFMIDRHNRLEFNLGKLTVLSLGEGANVFLEWMKEIVSGPPGTRSNRVDPRTKNAGLEIASGARDTATGRPSDISAFIMLSPVANWHQVRTISELKTYAGGSPVPILAMGGKKDQASAETLKLIKPIVERRESRLSKVEELDTNLHGARLLRFEPKLLEKINRFLEQTVEFQKTDWEPRYNLTPVTYGLVESVSRSAAAIAAAKAAVESKKEEAKPKPETKIPAADEKAKPAEPTKAKPSPLPESSKPSVETKPSAEKNTQEPKKVPNP
jgi:hypothetical protein